MLWTSVGVGLVSPQIQKQRGCNCVSVQNVLLDSKGQYHQASLPRAKHTHAYRCKSKYNGAVLLKWLLYCSETIDKMYLVTYGQEGNAHLLEIFYEIFSSLWSRVADKTGNN